MGLPCENEEGYVRGSPITYAHQMKSTQNLLLIHGTGSLYFFSVLICLFSHSSTR